MSHWKQTGLAASLVIFALCTSACERSRAPVEENAGGDPASSPRDDCAQADVLDRLNCTTADLSGLSREVLLLTETAPSRSLDDRRRLQHIGDTGRAERGACLDSDLAAQCVAAAYAREIYRLRTAFSVSANLKDSVSKGPFKALCHPGGVPLSYVLIATHPAMAYIAVDGDEAALYEEAVEGEAYRYVSAVEDINLAGDSRKAVLTRAAAPPLDCAVTP